MARDHVGTAWDITIPAMPRGDAPPPLESSLNPPPEEEGAGDEIATVHELLRAGPPPEVPSRVTAKDLMTFTFPEPKWAVAGLIPTGLSILAGDPKVGKSWFCLYLALCVATGTPFLGCATKSGGVLYLALEDGPRRLQHRLRRQLGQQEAPEGLILGTEIEAMDEGGLETLKRDLVHHGKDLRLVIIDVLARFRPRSQPRSRTMYDADYLPTAQLQELATVHDVAIVVVHHTRKNGDDDFIKEMSGTQGLTGAADTILLLKRPRNGNEGTLSVTGRDVEERQLALRVDSRTWRWSPSDKPVEAIGLDGTRLAIVDYLVEMDDASPKQIAEATGLKSDLVRRTLVRMLEDGQVERPGRGRYRLESQEDDRDDA